jgi:hypothetical protein
MHGEFQTVLIDDLELQRDDDVYCVTRERVWLSPC